MPPLKAIEQAVFGGVDSRSNPINMPTNRWLRCRNWIPRPDGHLELREGYTVIVPNQIPGGGAAYSLTPYTVATPNSSPVLPTIPNGTRCALWWQRSASGANVSTAFLKPIAGSSGIALVSVPVHGGSQALQMNAATQITLGQSSSFPLTAGVPVTLSAWVYLAQYAGTSPVDVSFVTFNAAGNAVAIYPASANTSTIGSWQLVTVTHSPTSTEVTGGMYIQINTQFSTTIQGQVTAYFDDVSLTQGGGGNLLVNGGFESGFASWVTTPAPIDTNFPVKGNPIVSTAPWHYALGKDGFLYMHNGVDAKFFDGVCFRDIGLPALTEAQTSPIRVQEGFKAPDPATVAAATLTWSDPGTFHALQNYVFYYTAFSIADNSIAPCQTPIGGGPAPTGADDLQKLTITGLPTVVDANTRFLVARNYNNSAGSVFVNVHCADTTKLWLIRCALVGSGSTVSATVTSTVHGDGSAGPLNHGLVTGDVVAIDNPGTPWHSSGPFAVTVIDATHFTFQAPQGVDASIYTTVECDFQHLLTVPYNVSTVTLVDDGGSSQLAFQGSSVSADGVQLPYVEDIASNLLPASTIGGRQPGYQFFACIYNPFTGHVGNRVQIGWVRLNNTVDCKVVITGLPNFTVAGLRKSLPRVRYGYGSRNILWGSKGGSDPIVLPSTDPEWRILIGRTGDGGEVPYACTDTNGNWITTNAPTQTSITISAGLIDENSQLPTENYPPPAFTSFWREGDRMGGSVLDQPFVFRSSSELDATTGIFVGDPAQSWSPLRVETFPTAEAVVGGFGFMQESWVFTRNDFGQVSQLSGDVAWNGPYGFGIVGSFAFAKGWQSLPFWISHDKQLCTMLPGVPGPISVSTEYETALLARIGDDYDADGNPLLYPAKTELVYFRDPLRMIDVLRIKCVDNNGNPFTVIHDFNLRDDSSPYGQGYEEIYLGPLGTDYQSCALRDSSSHARMWATASDGAIYQYYTGGLDNTDPIVPTNGLAFTADAVNLRYMGGEHTAVKTLEWYGDPLIQWFIYENMIDVIPDPLYWVNLSFEARPVPNDAGNAHYMADFERPEMTHCYLWAQLVAHPFDSFTPATPMQLSEPPHIPVENYGRLYLAAPILGDSRGR
jgi:hypothetical protein